MDKKKFLPVIELSGVHRMNNVVLFIFQTFIVGCKLHALFTLDCAEDSVFVIINKEKPGIV